MGENVTGPSLVDDLREIRERIYAQEHKAVSAGGGGVVDTVTAGTNLNGGGSADTVSLNLDTSLVGLSSVASASFTGALTGNASTATALETPRTIDITGDVTATAVAFDGTSNISISASVSNDSHTHDGRYFTEAESDGKYLLNTTDTLSGTFTATGAVRAGGGSAGAPGLSFNGDTDTGLYSITADQMGFVTGGALRARFYSGGLLMGGATTGHVNINPWAGAAWAPNYTFYGDSNTGMARKANDQAVLTGGGRWGVGAAATVPIMNIANTTQVGVYSAVVYDASSQRDHKRNIAAKSAPVSLSRILELEPVTFNYVKDKLPLREWAGELGEFETFEGFIAEDAYPAAQMLGWNRREGHDDSNNLTAEELVDEGYTLDEAVPTNIRWNVITTDLVGAVQEQAAQIVQLQEQNEALSVRLAALEEMESCQM